ncbi:MAG: FAD-binding oxidoreductase [Acidobacteria bacterium]|nr:FAD-binding oxidoreductase [Acidobacteriota bacterium]
MSSRVSTSLDLLRHLRVHDFRAARTFLASFYPGRSLPARVFLFAQWLFGMLWKHLPETSRWASIEHPVSRTPIWLAGADPFENHPFARDPAAKLPAEVEVAVIGAGMAGSAAAYHWSRLAATGTPAGTMAVIEMNSVAGGAAGRNEGLVVMGRYYYYVHHTVSTYLERTRTDLSAAARDRLAHEFADAYAKAAYANAEMIAETIERERIECDYVRKGWVQAANPDALDRLERSTRMARETGFADWVKISAEESFERAGIRVHAPSGFSIGAASWDPAKWVRGLMTIALRSPRVQLFTRTRVASVQDQGERYAIHTNRGTVLARFVINAAESHTPALFPSFHDIIQPMQTQAAWGPSDGGTMKAGVGISGDRAFFGRHAEGVIFGSDATRVPDHEAGRNQPSRFITRFVLTEMKRLFGVETIRVTNEWSGTVSYTPDEYPIVGEMDGKRMYMVGGMAGSGSGVSFNGAHHVVKTILGLDGPDYYPAKYFSALRFRRNASPGS